MVQRIFEITKKIEQRASSIINGMAYYSFYRGSIRFSVMACNGLKYFPNLGNFSDKPDAQKQTCLSDAMARKRLILGLIIVQKAGNSKKNNFSAKNITQYLEISQKFRTFATEIACS